MKHLWVIEEQIIRNGRSKWIHYTTCTKKIYATERLKRLAMTGWGNYRISKFTRVEKRRKG